MNCLENTLIIQMQVCALASAQEDKMPVHQLFYQGFSAYLRYMCVFTVCVCVCEGGKGS